MEENKNDSLKDVSSSELAREAAMLLIEKKGIDVRIFAVLEKSPITDYYVNVTGRSSTQVAALADELAFKLGERGREPLRIEGKRGNTWILVDYGDVIVNVFDKESREFYAFDRILPDGTEISVDDLVEAIDKKYDINNIKDNQKD